MGKTAWRGAVAAAVVLLVGAARASEELFSVVLAQNDRALSALLQEYADAKAAPDSGFDQAHVPVNLEVRGPRDATPLLWAVQHGYTEGVVQLVRAGADLEARDKAGYTPLSAAVYYGGFDSVKTLVAAGADHNVTFGADELRLTELACSGRGEEHLDILIYLVEALGKDVLANVGPHRVTCRQLAAQEPPHRDILSLISYEASLVQRQNSKRMQAQRRAVAAARAEQLAAQREQEHETHERMRKTAYKRRADEALMKRLAREMELNQQARDIEL